MDVLWFLIGLTLILLSSALCVAGFTGRQGVLRIGKRTVAESHEQTGDEPREHPRMRSWSANAPNVVIGIVGTLVGVAIMVMLFI